MVFAMRFTSSLVERVSVVTILVPSDRMTCSKGVIMKANGRLHDHLSDVSKIIICSSTHARHSMMRKAM